MVDTVLYLEGEKFGPFRLLRTTKNRFGATDEVGVFEMTDKGMLGIENPSKIFLAQRQKGVPGSVIVATMEGTRPVLVEIQALVTPTQLAIPRRVAAGIDYNRLQLICAVLAKRLGLPLASFDIFVNVAGGLRIEEPAVDLGVALAIYSSFKNVATDTKTVVFGELGLLGEVRNVSQNQQRVKEAKRLGFTKIISPEKYSSINQVVKIFKS
jgi:DNA repair protein RadA/Sms